jgi:hypothetical protein
MELEASYALTNRWDVTARFPVDIRSQSASIQFLEAAEDGEREAILRNSRVHHRDETYSGLSDPSLLAVHRRSGVFGAGDAVRIAAGVTIPLGSTEPDPYVLGDQGLEHLHIQFGTGTFNPVFELNYLVPVTGVLRVGGFARGRASFYENSHGFRAPSEAGTGVTAFFQARDNLSLYGTGSFDYQGFGAWSGNRDENTGVASTAVRMGGSLRVSDRTSVGADIRWSISQRTLVDSGDTFTPGPGLSLRLLRVFTLKAPAHNHGLPPSGS